MPAARAAFGDFFSADDLLGNGLGSIDPASLSIVPPSASRGVMALPAHVDAGKPVFSQLVIPDPQWRSGYVALDVAKPDGTRVGSLEMEWNGEDWEAVGSSYGNTDDWLRPKQADAERKLVASLGGSVDETASVGLWLLGKHEGREAGIIPWKPGLMYSGETPDEGRVYAGEELAHWLNAFRR